MRRTSFGGRFVSAIAAVAAALAGCSSTVTPPEHSPARPAAPPHFALVDSLLRDLRPQDTNYQHKPTLVAWAGDPDHERAECRADCSGLVTAVLARAYSLSDADVADLFGAKRPRARNFHDAIAAARAFRRVAFADALPGDVLAISFPAGSEDTGHVMFVASPPRARDATPPIVPGTTQWELDVVDSTGSPHGPSDPRYSKTGRPRTGAGRGTIRIYTQASGAIAGYAWSTGAKSEFRAQETRDAALGRFVPPKAGAIATVSSPR